MYIYKYYSFIYTHKSYKDEGIHETAPSKEGQSWGCVCRQVGGHWASFITRFLQHGTGLHFSDLSGSLRSTWRRGGKMQRFPVWVMITWIFDKGNWQSWVCTGCLADIVPCSHLSLGSVPRSRTMRQLQSQYCACSKGRIGVETQPKSLCLPPVFTLTKCKYLGMKH